jgi:hypothetical protein
MSVETFVETIVRLPSILVLYICQVIRHLAYMYCSAQPVPGIKPVTRLPFVGLCVAEWCGACHLTILVEL